MSDPIGTSAAPTARGTAPAKAGLVLTALILASAVANLNLAVANVALPTIGDAFNATQVQLNLVAVGYSLGLAASVLYLGAVGDRYGRKLMLMGGLLLSIVACIASAYAPNPGFLVVARIVGGLSAGMAYPTTLALITALWSGPQRTKSIALWSALGGGVSMLGPLLAGLLLEDFWWGSVFLLTLPLVAVAIPMVWRFVPAHVNEETEPVDNLGGVLSIFFVGALILGINFAPVPGSTTMAFVLIGLSLVIGGFFIWRQRRASNPLYDLKVAARPTFWVAATGGIIVFGSLMGVAFVSQQYLQNVLGYDTVAAGAAILPAVVMMVLVAPRSARLVESHGSRRTLLSGQAFLVVAIVIMLVFWTTTESYWVVGLAYVFLGIGVGLAGTPSSNSLTGSVPVKRVGMASGTADLQRDLGGALMTSLFGALLTAGYAGAMSSAIGSSKELSDVTQSTQSQLTMSFEGAEAIAAQHPKYASQITEAAKQSFLDGDQWAYIAGLVLVLIGMFVVFRFYPRHQQEVALKAEYARESDSSASGQHPNV
ncbi:MAG TPA: MFS transporter [Actinomycetes bacterium]|nr:MFS transporter [Actinomycetes bacterium]